MQAGQKNFPKINLKNKNLINEHVEINQSDKKQCLNFLYNFNKKNKTTEENEIIIENIEKFINILIEENESLNLISKNSIKNIWTRHILDSVQLNIFLDKILKNSINSIVIDLGTGNGIPIIPIILTFGLKNIDYTLTEKSVKKKIFLEKAIKRLNLTDKKENKINILNINLRDDKIFENSYNNCYCNINNYEKIIFTSRAFKGLSEILNIIDFNLNSEHKNKIKIILLKGKTVYDEIEEAKKFFDFEFNLENSLTNEGFVLFIENISKK